jgi:hypothetical protein
MKLFSILLLGIASVGQAQTLQFDATVGTELRRQVQDDFSVLSGIQGARNSTLHREIFGPMEGQAYAHWFSDRVSYFGLSDCGSPQSAVACVEPKIKRKIWVTKNYTGIDHPQIARVMTLFHEARHTEDEHGNWSHSRCPIFYKEKSIWTGKGLRWHYACDSTPYGSYASASVMLHNIARYCMNCSGKWIADASLYSNDQIKRVVKRKAKLRLRADFAE